MKYYKLINPLNSIILKSCEDDVEISIPNGYIATLIDEEEYNNIKEELTRPIVEDECID